MFEIHVEWEDAPGVRDPLLARTWARLELRLHGRPVTKYWSERSASLRDGIHGSVFPLADWIANNWWSLLYEGLRHHPSGVSARASRPRLADTWQWLRRHNLLTCREGMAYPDLAIFRREDDIQLCWFPDPADTTTQGRFMDEGMVTLERATVEAALESLVIKVLARVGELHDESVAALAELWNEISASMHDRSETALCQRLAMLGQDPYAAEQPGALEEAVGQLSFTSGLVQDLLAASTPDELANDVSSTKSLLAGLPPPTELHPPRASGFASRAEGELLPYRAGYARASEVREHLGLADDEPLNDLDEVIARLMGEPVETWQSRGEPGPSKVDAAVQVNGVAAVSAVQRRLKSDERFLLGRALHHWLYATTETTPQRLLTKGHDWLQASSRAFAAELLAPARALSRRLGGGADWDRPDELAEEFQVSAKVIAHQIENHRLG